MKPFAFVVKQDNSINMVSRRRCPLERAEASFTLMMLLGCKESCVLISLFARTIFFFFLQALVSLFFLPETLIMPSFLPTQNLRNSSPYLFCPKRPVYSLSTFYWLIYLYSFTRANVTKYCRLGS